jgi:hypothetical protein
MLSTSSRLSHPAPSGRYPPGLSFVGVTILNSSAGAEDAASPRMMTRISSGEISQNSAVLGRRSQPQTSAAAEAYPSLGPYHRTLHSDEYVAKLWNRLSPYEGASANVLRDQVQRVAHEMALGVFP